MHQTLLGNWKVQKLSPLEMVDHKKHGLFYNYDERYSLGHKCKEQKLFHKDVNTPTHSEEIIMKDTTEVEMDYHTLPMQEAVELEIPQEEPNISLHFYHV